MKKSYSLIKIFEGVRSMSDLTWAIARLKEIQNTLPNDAKMYMAFEGSSFINVWVLVGINMNKYEIKYLLETMTSSVDRLTDSLGKQSLHIENLWHEIGEKQNLIANQRYEIKKLKERLLEIYRKEHKDRLEDADFEKRFKEFIGESVDH